MPSKKQPARNKRRSAPARLEWQPLMNSEKALDGWQSSRWEWDGLEAKRKLAQFVEVIGKLLVGQDYTLVDGRLRPLVDPDSNLQPGEHILVGNNTQWELAKRGLQAHQVLSWRDAGVPDMFVYNLGLSSDTPHDEERIRVTVNPDGTIGATLRLGQLATVAGRDDVGQGHPFEVGGEFIATTERVGRMWSSPNDEFMRLTLRPIPEDK